MHNRGGQFYVTKALTPYLVDCYFNTTSVTDYALVPCALEFTATALVILDWSEYLFAEKPIWLGLEIAI
ncbi:MAG: hypothetical protein BWX90_00218 [bacterium ADurb.Bin132]|nr:MAG: hypothetical protein BWX90_00218 [bacterium ADurb.Bin132]